MEKTLTEEKVNQKTVRFRNAKWYSPETPVIIGGVGGIGNNT